MCPYCVPSVSLWRKYSKCLFCKGLCYLCPYVSLLLLY
jgi:hypothetical protein